MMERAGRRPSTWNVQLSTRDCAFSATIHNVSETGMFAKGRMPMPTGERVRVKPTCGSVMAEVERVRSDGVALRFPRRLSEPQLARLCEVPDLNAVWSHAGLAFPAPARTVPIAMSGHAL